MFFWMTAALAAPCTQTTVENLSSIKAPAVLVLGERPGNTSDVKRAVSIVERLAKRDLTVTVAMEAVEERNQDVLTRFDLGELDVKELPSTMGWDGYWGTSFKPYADLFSRDWRLVAAGPTVGPVPVGKSINYPADYPDTLVEEFSTSLPRGAEVLPGELASFTRNRAWRDRRIAELATSKWSGVGVLVILTDREHVEGNQGTGWQLGKMTDARIYPVLLNKKGATCPAGDRVLK